MSLAQEWSISTFFYDKGFYEGAKAILNMQLSAKTLSEIQSLVSSLEQKFNQLEAVHAEILKAQHNVPKVTVEVSKPAPKKAKKK
jgi:hypothetical protein